jgi:hypothetical protein
MSFSPIYGIQQTRIVLYADDETTPTSRITLEKEAREGLELSFKAEGVHHQLGSGAEWARAFTMRGWRMTLAIKWAVGLESTIEIWNAGTQAWGQGAQIPTAEALSLIIGSGARVPLRVSPHKDKNLDFLAQPDPGKDFRLKDIKGLAHTDLETVLVATKLRTTMPAWGTLNDYFAQGAVAPGFVEFQP